MEAMMVVGMFNHLVYNGVDAKAITVLTFYNGQRKEILKSLKRHPNLQGRFFNVKTVDSYQGRLQIDEPLQLGISTTIADSV